MSVERPPVIESYDNPETIRLKKYATGTHLLQEEAGIETGRTPKEVVWTRNKARLYRYESTAEKRYPVPVLLIYALILRPYILDLVPGNSFVEYLVGEGYDVYLLDWGVPGDEDKDLTFENYVLDYMPRVVRKVLRNSGAEELTLFGYCQGGTMSTMYASLFPGKHLKNLVLLATPVNFAPDDAELFRPWTSEEFFDPDPVVEVFGNVPADLVGRFIESAPRMPKSLVDYARPWERIGREGSLDSWLAASKWVDDGVPFPGEAFRRWIKDFYQQDKLVKRELKLRGRRVDLSDIECPVLNIAGKKDHICPLPQAEPTTDLIGSRDKEFLVLDAGHVGLMAGPVAKDKLWPRISNWLEPRSK